MMYAQELKNGDEITMNGTVYTVDTVTYVPGYHGKYAVQVLAKYGSHRKTRFTFFAGEQVETPAVNNYTTDLGTYLANEA